MKTAKYKNLHRKMAWNKFTKYLQWLPLRNEPINDYFSSSHFFQFSYTKHIFLLLKKKGKKKKKVSTYPDKLVPEISLGEEWLSGEEEGLKLSWSSSEPCPPGSGEWFFKSIRKVLFFNENNNNKNHLQFCECDQLFNTYQHF